MTHAITVTYSTLHHHRERIFATLAVAIVITAGAYVFLLQKAIVNVVEREKVAHDVTLESTHVGDLETSYFALKNSITLDLAHAKGFKTAEVTAYIQKKAITAMASNNEL